MQSAARKHPGLRQTKKVAAHNEAVRARREAVKVETRLTLEAEVAKPAVAPVAPVAPKLGKKA